jgi:two-component system LytT family response regulator
VSIGVLVVDDEPIARHAIVRLLRDDPGIEVLGECGDGVSAVAQIRRHSPDLVFLDIQMPAMGGMDVVAAVGAERMPATVFVTAYEQYAVRAFEANAVDYLIKPFSRERFLVMLHRAKARLSSTGSEQAASHRLLLAIDELRRREGYLERIPVRVDEQVLLVAVDDIAWIKANRNTVQLHAGGKTYEVRATMARLATRLDPRHFVRVHRSAIVNMRRVKSIQPWFNGYHVVVLDSGEQLRMSRYQHESFMRLATLHGEPI